MMSIVEQRSVAREADYLAGDKEISPMTSICVGLVVALAIYVLGSAILLRGPDAAAPQSKVPAETPFVGP